MIEPKTSREIEILAEGGKILASILNEVTGKVEPELPTKELDDLAFSLIKKAGGKPAFLGYKGRVGTYPYPASLCVSVNDEVVHGIPSREKILKEGDIVGLDIGMECKGLFTDMAVTVGVGNISDKAKKLIDATKKSLEIGMAEIREGAKLGDYGFAVQSFAEKNGFGVVRILVGHGVGYAAHEDPDIPNWGKKGKGMEFKEGMVLALEPMLCQGGYEVVLGDDEWTWKTKDGLLSAHFEHTISVEKNGCRVLTKI